MLGKASLLVLELQPEEQASGKPATTWALSLALLSQPGSYPGSIFFLLSFS